MHTQNRIEILLFSIVFPLVFKLSNSPIQNTMSSYNRFQVFAVFIVYLIMLVSCHLLLLQVFVFCNAVQKEIQHYFYLFTLTILFIYKKRKLCLSVLPKRATSKNVILPFCGVSSSSSSVGMWYEWFISTKPLHSQALHSPFNCLFYTASSKAF